MTERVREAGVRAPDLRAAFDRAFAEPPQVERDDFEDLLAVRVSTAAYAVRVREVAGLFKEPRVTALPTPAPHLLGLVGLKGIVLPVYDLAGLLGRAGGKRLPRWLFVAAGPDAVAFSFDGFEGQFRVPREATAAGGAEADGRGAGRAVRIGGELRPLVDVAGLLNGIKGRVSRWSPPGSAEP